MNEMSERTHWDGCWRERTHHECAVARCEELERERDARALADAIYPTGAAPLGDAVRRIGEMKDERDAALARADALAAQFDRLPPYDEEGFYIDHGHWGQERVSVAAVMDSLRGALAAIDAARAEEPKA